MPRSVRDWDPCVRGLFSVIAAVVPVLAAVVIYVEWSTPALDCVVDTQTGTVRVVAPESNANYAGLQPGDLILTVDGIPYRSWKSTDTTNHAVVVRRGTAELPLELPVLPYGQLYLPHLISALIVALTFSGLGTFLYWRRGRLFEVRLFFLMVQSIAVGLLLFLAFPDATVRPFWMSVASSVGFHLSATLLFHFYLTFPVVLASPARRKVLLGAAYGLMPVALAFRLSGTDVGLRITYLFNTIEIAGAVIALVYSYRRRATSEGRRRARLVVFGGLMPAVAGFVVYLLPTIAGSPYLTPDWMVGPLLIVSPLSYVLAIARHNLFDLDRVLNRTTVYVILWLGILLLYLGPFLLIYGLLPGDWPLQIVVVAGLTLFAGGGFDWTRARVQRWVDRIFYGGWYDYPAVVETASDALARSIERVQLTNVLTVKIPELMQLRQGELVFADTAPVALPGQPSPLQFSLRFQDLVRAVWIVGARRDGEEFTGSDKRILNTLARQGQVALGNVLLVEMLRSQLDELGKSRETAARAQGQLLRSRDDERARLARDLHDGPIQDLVGLNMQLGLLIANATPPLSESLAGMRAEVRSLLTDLRQVCAELRPPMLDTLGLGAAMRVLADSWSRSSGVALTLDMPSDDVLRAFPASIAINLYWLAQEALTNIARHAGAHAASLCLDWRDPELTLTIADDGCGFAVPTDLHGPALQGHLGLLGMQERTSLIGARWSIQSHAGQGTTIRIVWCQHDYK